MVHHKNQNYKSKNKIKINFCERTLLCIVKWLRYILKKYLLFIFILLQFLGILYFRIIE